MSFQLTVASRLRSSTRPDGDPTQADSGAEIRPFAPRTWRAQSKRGTPWQRTRRPSGSRVTPERGPKTRRLAREFSISADRAGCVNFWSGQIGRLGVVEPAR